MRVAASETGWVKEKRRMAKSMKVSEEKKWREVGVKMERIQRKT